MPDTKVYFLDEARDKYAQIRKRFRDGEDDELVYNMVNCLLRGGMPKDVIMGYLQNIAILCDPLTMEQEVFDKVNRSIEICSENKEKISLAQEVRDFVMSSNGYFLSTDVSKCLQVSSRKDQKNISRVLGRLVDEGVVKRYGKKHGCFRVVDKSCEKIDWKNNKDQSIDIVLPLSLNQITKIYPRNIIVIAGMVNAGKTAFLMNTVALNLDRFAGKIKFFSSEMGECELKNRIEAFKIGVDAWEQCDFFSRSGNFVDVLDPDCINIIDYFEISDNFWIIGKDFEEIYNKLKDGIAIIALQKNPDRKTGRGGTFSREKPRLYLSLDEEGDCSVMEIIEAKNYITEFNPKGYTKRFKITNKGTGLLELGNWEAPQYGR